MPELPEVETVKRTLADRLQAVKIEDVKVLQPVVIKNMDPGDFIRTLKGRNFEGFERRGKFLLLTLDNHLVMVVHLRMTGRLVVTAADFPIVKHTHVVWVLSSGEELRFIDVRRFGTIHLLSRSSLNDIKGLREMGPEPLEVSFNTDYLSQKLAGKQRNIKAFLLDQSIVAGIGNIYADEILAQARILPQRAGGSLDKDEIKALHRSTRSVLQEAIAHRGTTFRDYVDGSGNKGMHQHHLKVYQREGEPCKNCGALIVKDRVAGRGTYFCKTCQS